MRRIACSLSLVLLGGCLMQNIAPSERLRDAVVGLNDEARWSRMDLATMRVAPAFRSAWARSHRDWGRNVQIGDVELLDVRIDDATGDAVSLVAVSWYSYDTMTLQRTVLRQEWESAGREYVLANEVVIEGSAALLAAEPEPERDPEREEVSSSASASTST